MDSTLIKHCRSPSFIDAPFGYDSLNLEPYLQYPQSPYGVSMMACKSSSSSPQLDFDSLNLANTIGEYSYSSAPYAIASPSGPYTLPDNSISPPAVYNISAGELSSDSLNSGRRSSGSGTHSPASVHSVPYAAAVPQSHRFNPIAPPATLSATKSARRKSRNDDSDNEDKEFQPAASNSGNNDARRETIRNQRIESEQRRRNELRDGYRRLTDALPVSNQKSSKVSLLDRATTHIKLQQAENEVQRLRTVDEALMLGTAEQRQAAAAAAAIAAMSQ
ncbi:hypothetical protein EDD15DRAFT_2480371 [Pisolithus albus]|nr:hypothetical protein EDD15DRAFT_2480371 [Pisolithus albus]